MLPSFPRTLTLREAFETAAQLNKGQMNGIQWSVLQNIQTSTR